MKTDALLSVRQLSIRFKTEEGIFPAIDQISFDLQRGETTAIVGESGSGKSVTALSILKLLSPTAVYHSGNIVFNEGKGDVVDILSVGETEIRKLRGNRISMIFQEPMTSLNPLMKCGQQVMETLKLHYGYSNPEARQKTIELFSLVELPSPESMLQRYPHQLSGGQKQRVMIAMAISCEPALLIADEPTTALDVTVQKNILKLLRALQEKLNMAVIFITHDLGLVSEIADQVLVMYKGKVVEQGPAKNVLNNPTHPYTKALLACRPILHSPGSRLPMVSDFLDGEGGVHSGAANSFQKSTLDNEPALDKQPKPDKETTLDNERPVVKNGGTQSPAKEPVAMPLLEVRDLKVWFPGQKNILGKITSFSKAVDGVDFELLKGETLGLVGESGCGKTTLGRAILRLNEITEGKIIYKGKDITHLGRKEMKPFRKEIQIIFQDPYSSLNPRIPVGMAIKEVLEVYGVGSSSRDRQERAINLLEKVGLTSAHFSRYPHEFSGGQRQRIGIARALALDPSFMVCDESVSALDVSVQAQVLNLLNDLKKEFGFTTLFISHDLSVVHHVSDRIMVMNKGKIEETGRADDIYYRPMTPYTKRLIEASPGKPGGG